MDDFYDRLAPFYHIIYKDWDAAVETQATQLSNIIQAHWGEKAQSILDVSCGVGTQAIGLASRGYNVTASDISSKEIERAKEAAQLRDLSINFSVCDMREVYRHHQAQFDVVISCDNSIPNLLNDEEILKALKQIYACTRRGGGCLLTMRDYDKEARGTGLVKPYGIREAAGKRYFVFQVWDFEGEIYDVSMYFIEEDRQSGTANTHLMRSRYYALSPNRLMQLMEAAGYTSITRLDDQFFQPVLIGKK
ncbi:MAG: class I SAM-dependent methyltransferase [Cyanobacteria bacterium J06638_22]